MVLFFFKCWFKFGFGLVSVLWCRLNFILTTLLANSTDEKFMIFFYMFPRKQDLTFHANCLHWRQYAQNVKICFFREKKKENYFECRLLKILSRALYVLNKPFPLKSFWYIPKLNYLLIGGVVYSEYWLYFLWFSLLQSRVIGVVCGGHVLTTCSGYLRLLSFMVPNRLGLLWENS